MIQAAPRVPPTATADAIEQVDQWLASPNDAHLAALAISHGLRIASHDSGFARFPAVRWFDPLFLLVSDAEATIADLG